MGLSDITSGLTDRFSGDGGEGGSSGEDDFLGDAGELGEGFGDDLEGDDFGGMDDWDEGDDFGGMDDWDDEGDALGGGGGGGANLDPRIEELENEVASLSSTMGTVRSENEAIQESVEDIEDNIRKLLEIYEMVTRGVNPFVDEPQGGGGMGGSFGLFEEAGDDDGLGDLDPDVADADPDSFFDDDFDDGGLDDEFDEDDFDDDAVVEDPFGGDVLEAEESGADAAGDEGGSGDDGKTFDELKSEYQADDAAWEDADQPEEASDGSDAEPEPESVPQAEATDTGDDASVAEGSESGSLVDEALEDLTPSEGQDETSAGGGSGDDDVSGQDTEGSRDGKPYLESLPSGYGVELLVIEWLSYLRNQSSTSEALRAIKYYETIGWIGSPAANSLQRYLSGLAGEDVDTAPGGGTQLTIDHHTNSLHYIGKIGGTDVDVKRLEWTGPARSSSRVERRGQRGIQR